MRIPSEILNPYLIEISSQPQADNGVAEPVEAAARLRNTLPQSNRNRQSEADQKDIIVASEKPQPYVGKPGERPSGNERRQGERRQESRPVLLDTRLSKSRRKPVGYSSINFEI